MPTAADILAGYGFTPIGTTTPPSQVSFPSATPGGAPLSGTNAPPSAYPQQVRPPVQPQPAQPQPSAGQSAQIYGSTATGQPLTAAQLQQQAQETVAYGSATGPSYVAGRATVAQNYITFKLASGQEVRMNVSEGFAEKYRTAEASGGFKAPAPPTAAPAETPEQEAARLYPKLGVGGKVYVGLLTFVGPESFGLLKSQFTMKGGQIVFAPSEAAAKPYLVSTIVREAGTQYQPGQPVEKYGEALGSRLVGFSQSVPGILITSYGAGTVLAAGFRIAETLMVSGALAQTATTAFGGQAAIDITKVVEAPISTGAKLAELGVMAGSFVAGAKGMSVISRPPVEPVGYKVTEAGGAIRLATEVGTPRTAVELINPREYFSRTAPETGEFYRGYRISLRQTASEMGTQREFRITPPSEETMITADLAALQKTEPLPKSMLADVKAVRDIANIKLLESQTGEITRGTYQEALLGGKEFVQHTFTTPGLELGTGATIRYSAEAYLPTEIVKMKGMVIPARPTGPMKLFEYPAEAPLEVDVGGGVKAIVQAPPSEPIVAMEPLSVQDIMSARTVSRIPIFVEPVYAVEPGKLVPLQLPRMDVRSTVVQLQPERFEMKTRSDLRQDMRMGQELISPHALRTDESLVQKQQVDVLESFKLDTGMRFDQSSVLKMRPPVVPLPVPKPQQRETKGKKAGPRIFRGFLKWRQGFVYRMWNPLTGESKATRKPIQGVAYARGIKSAYRSATLSGEYVPAATRKMGIVNVKIGETLGTKPKLSFIRRRF